MAEAVWIPVTVDDPSTAQSGHYVNMVPPGYVQEVENIVYVFRCGT